MMLWILRIVAVVVFLGLAAAIATPKGRLPLPLRGVQQMLRRDQGVPEGTIDGNVVSVWKKLLAFLLVLLAVAVAMI